MTTQENINKLTPGDNREESLPIRFPKDSELPHLLPEAHDPEEAKKEVLDNLQAIESLINSIPGLEDLPASLLLHQGRHVLFYRGEVQHGRSFQYASEALEYQYQEGCPGAVIFVGSGFDRRPGNSASTGTTASNSASTGTTASNSASTGTTGATASNSASTGTTASNSASTGTTASNSASTGTTASNSDGATSRLIESVSAVPSSNQPSTTSSRVPDSTSSVLDRIRFICEIMAKVDRSRVAITAGGAFRFVDHNVILDSGCDVTTATFPTYLYHSLLYFLASDPGTSPTSGSGGGGGGGATSGSGQEAIRFSQRHQYGFAEVMDACGSISTDLYISRLNGSKFRIWVDQQFVEIDMMFIRGRGRGGGRGGRRSDLRIPLLVGMDVIYKVQTEGWKEGSAQVEEYSSCDSDSDRVDAVPWFVGDLVWPFRGKEWRATAAAATPDIDMSDRICERMEELFRYLASTPQITAGDHLKDLIEYKVQVLTSLDDCSANCVMGSLPDIFNKVFEEE